jgi:hypothetical protein
MLFHHGWKWKFLNIKFNKHWHHFFMPQGSRYTTILLDKKGHLCNWVVVHLTRRFENGYENIKSFHREHIALQSSLITVCQHNNTLYHQYRPKHQIPLDLWSIFTTFIYLWLWWASWEDATVSVQSGMPIHEALLPGFSFNDAALFLYIANARWQHSVLFFYRLR